jgi:hypothetical protein
MMASRNVETLETFFKAPSPDALYNLMAESCVYRDHSLGQVYEGRDADRSRFTAGCAMVGTRDADMPKGVHS